MMIARRWLLSILLVATILCCSCNPQPPLAKVSGVVLLDGEPLPGVVVEFLPDPDQKTHGPRSSATTDAAGRFKLICDDQREGAVIGFHRVLIQDPRAFPPPRPRPGESFSPSAPRIPETYWKATETPLRVEVKPEAEELTLEVTTR